MINIYKKHFHDHKELLLSHKEPKKEEGKKERKRGGKKEKRRKSEGRKVNIYILFIT